MQNSKGLLKQANIIPRLRLAVKQANGVRGTGPHRVKLLEDKIVKGKSFDGKIIDKVRYIVEENGQKRMYECPVKDKDTGDLHYLVQRMSEFNEGDEVVMEYKRKGVKGHIEVLSVNGGVDADESEKGIIDDEDVIDLNDDIEEQE